MRLQGHTLLLLQILGYTSGDWMGFILGVVGTAQQLETANASGGGGSAPSTQGTAPNPTGVAISDSSNPFTNFTMSAQEVSNAQNASNPDGADQFDVNFSNFSNGQADITIDISNNAGDLNAAYSGQSSTARIAFLGYIQATNATSFQWSLSVSSSLSAGSAAVSYTSGTAASTDRDATTYSATLGQTKGIEAFCDITWGGGRGGLIFPSNGDTVTCTIGADATNSNGTTSADDLVIEYTFST